MPKVWIWWQVDFRFYLQFYMTGLSWTKRKLFSLTFAQFSYALTLKVLLYLKNDKIFYCNIKINFQYFKPHKINRCVTGETMRGTSLLYNFVTYLQFHNWTTKSQESMVWFYFRLSDICLVALISKNIALMNKTQMIVSAKAIEVFKNQSERAICLWDISALCGGQTKE